MASNLTFYCRHDRSRLPMGWPACKVVGEVFSAGSGMAPVYAAISIIRGKDYRGKVGPRERARAARRLAAVGDRRAVA